LVPLDLIQIVAVSLKIPSLQKEPIDPVEIAQIMVHGESGSGKTILTKLLMDLIDPRDEKALSIPKDDRALIVFAKQTFLIGFENISHIPTWFSDALCRLASGDSFVAVKL
jgi:hypothetical protein